MNSRFIAITRKTSSPTERAAEICTASLSRMFGLLAAATATSRFGSRTKIRRSAARSVGDDVLRVIAMNREFTRHYQVKLNLVTNPRTPFTFVSRLIPLLRDNDLKVIAKSKNVSGAVAQAVKQQISRKG